VSPENKLEILLALTQSWIVYWYTAKVCRIC
jgi:hypothetical protein